MGNAPKRKTTQTKPRPRTAAAAAPDRPWGKWAGYAAGGLLVVALVAFLVTDTEPASGVPDGAVEVTVGDPTHIEGDIEYDEAEPAGGPHNPIWQNCGFYETTVRTENAVHSLEHGVVWITYSDGVGDDAVGTLRSIADRRLKVLVSAAPDQASPILLRAWGWRLELDTVDDDRLDQFLNNFEGSLEAPEPGGACTGGVGTPA